MSTSLAHEEIELPSVRLHVQTEPVPYDEAVTRSINGRYTAVVSVPVHAVFGAASSKTVQRFLARSVIASWSTSEVEYAPIAFGDSGRLVYVTVSVLLDIDRVLGR